MVLIGVQKKWILKNARDLCRHIFVFLREIETRYSYRLRFWRMQKGLSEPALSSSPAPFDYAKKFRTNSRRGRYFRRNLDRDKAESTQLPRNTIPREIFAKKFSGRSNSFRRHRFRTTSEVSIPKGRSPILTRSTLVFPALDRTLHVETTELLSYFV